MFGSCCFLLPWGLTRVVRPEYSAFAGLIGVIGGFIAFFPANFVLYVVWPCRGDKRRAKHSLHLKDRDTFDAKDAFWQVARDFGILIGWAAGIAIGLLILYFITTECAALLHYYIGLDESFGILLGILLAFVFACSLGALIRKLKADRG